MNVDYKAMSEKGMPEAIDLIPSWAFWREGCHVFAKNVIKVLEMAKIDDEATIIAFIRSLPLYTSDLASPRWQAGVCSQCLKKAYENTPDTEKKEFAAEVMDYFLYYFIDRDRVSKFMLIDALLGFTTALLAATKNERMVDKS